MAAAAIYLAIKINKRITVENWVQILTKHSG